MNQALAKNENLERELNTKNEVMKQFEKQKREYINKLKDELDTVEERFQQTINENAMIGEDFRSTAMLHFNNI